MTYKWKLLPGFEIIAKIPEPDGYTIGEIVTRLIRERDEARQMNVVLIEGRDADAMEYAKKARAKAIDEAAAAIEHWSPVCGCLKLVLALKDKP